MIKEEFNSKIKKDKYIKENIRKYGVKNMNDEEKIKELTLLLLYLSSWNEEGYRIDESDNIIETKIKRSWKGYDFDILNALENERLLNGSYKSKSVYFTKNGENKALELYKKYFGVDYED